jgi:2,3-bisphosphoglycerate-independent phosphoglycerate mutase
MKYIVLLGDGMSDYPLENQNGKTPLQLSRIPNMDSLAQKGEMGLARTIPEGMPPGSDVANLSVMGYDPKVYYSGRAPIEAASMGVDLGANDIAFRCNLVTLMQEGSAVKMHDYSAGHISTEEARHIIQVLQAELGSSVITFYPGVSYRHLMVWRQGEHQLSTTPPHDITGKVIEPYLPQGEGSSTIIEIMQRAREILAGLQNKAEGIDQGPIQANSIWLWGQGKSIKIPTLRQKYGLSGAVISAVDLVKGLGVCAGLTPIAVAGATGYLDTNYEGKANAALDALETSDFVYLHVEAPDEASHKGNLAEKIRAIEDFDTRVVKVILEGLEKRFSHYRVMVLPDHPTPIATKTHAPDPVPFVIFASEDKAKNGKSDMGFNEKDASETGMLIQNGWKLMDRFIG